MVTRYLAEQLQMVEERNRGMKQEREDDSYLSELHDLPVPHNVLLIDLTPADRGTRVATTEENINSPPSPSPS